MHLLTFSQKSSVAMFLPTDESVRVEITFPATPPGSDLMLIWINSLASLKCPSPRIDAEKVSGKSIHFPSSPVHSVLMFVRQLLATCTVVQTFNCYAQLLENDGEESCLRKSSFNPWVSFPITVDVQMVDNSQSKQTHFDAFICPLPLT